MAPTAPAHHASTLVPAFREFLAANVPEFKERSEPDLVCDTRLQRFLMARDEDFAKAAKMIEDHLRWRKEHDIERIRALVVDKPFSPTYFPHFDLMHKLNFGLTKTVVNAGEAHNGEIIHIELMGGGLDTLEEPMDKATFESNLMEHYYAFFERRSIFLEGKSKEQNRMVRNIQIRDLSRLSLKVVQGANVGLIRKVLGSGLDNYPEMGSKAIFTNAPTYFSVIWAIVSTMLTKKTHDKVQFVSGLPHEVNLELIKYARPPALECLSRLLHDGDGARLTDWIASGAPRNSGKESFECSVKHGNVDSLVFYLPRSMRLKWQVTSTPKHPGQAHVLHNADGSTPTCIELSKAEERGDTEVWQAEACACDCAVVIALSNATSWWNDRNFRVDAEWQQL